jgi:ABC-2 type transport system ATP-binding protein
MISIKNLSKTYNNGAVKALTDINLEVGRGELFGLIGPDGAGKTTLFRVLTTLLLPDTGTGSINGLDLQRDYQAIRNTVGYMPGRFSLYQDLTIEENMEFFATVFGTTVADNYEQIKPIYRQIEPFKTRRAGQLSGGMKQKLALCCALVHQPDLLLLDEPTTGVDPVSRDEFWDMLHLLRSTGLTMLVSTPYMDEARRCDRIALIQKGQILDMDTPDAIVRRNQQPMLAVRGEHMFDMLLYIRSWAGAVSCYAFGESHHVALQPDANTAQLRAFLEAGGFGGAVIEPITPDIEDVFIQLMSETTL